MNQEEPILVAIHCLVYNHEPYLRDCFEGFVMQKTNFRFVAIVHEDCSTDHSADIIREYEAKYPDIFRPIYETENQWHKTDGSLGRIMNAAIDATGAKYVAMCEGDDYWTDPYKLQKQVDIMESHPEYGCCCHRFVEYDERSKSFSSSDHWASVITDKMTGFELNKENYFSIDLLPQILTTVYRRQVLESQSQYQKINPRSQYDQSFFYALVQVAPIWIINQSMGVYRRHNGGVATSISGTLKAPQKMYLTWKDIYEVYKTEDVKSLYIGNLSLYIYRYVKMADSISPAEMGALLKELGKITSNAAMLHMYIRILRAYMIRFVNKIHKTNGTA